MKFENQTVFVCDSNDSNFLVVSAEVAKRLFYNGCASVQVFHAAYGYWESVHEEFELEPGQQFRVEVK
jgi:hypothetical protein